MGPPTNLFTNVWGAQVGDEDARRRTLRNDLTVKASSTWSDWQLSTAPFWTLQTLDFKGETTSLKGILQRIGLDVSAGRMFSGTASYVHPPIVE